MSPDGERIAFTVTQADEERDRLVSHIWVVPHGGGEPVQWTHGPEGETSPRWSPDGARLAYLAARGEDRRPQVHVLDTRGGDARRLTDLPGGVSDLAWSPDGSRLAVVASVPLEIGEDEPLQIDRLGYKFDGAGIQLRRRLHLFRVPADGS